jgi:hypothetical protein
MRVFKGKSIYTLCAIPVLLFVGTAFSSSSEPMLPDGLIIEDIFKPGLGAPVGKVLLVQGKAVIMHKRMPRGYWAKKGLPLFKGDTIITQQKGRIRFELNDRSIVSLASRTKMVINKSVYDPIKKSRLSFLKMALGRGRFLVRKLFDLNRSRFSVKTPTAVVGVRGSDFIIRATPQVTEVTALEKTRLEVVSLAAPEVKPMVITDFERTTVEIGAPPSDVEMVAPEEIEQMKSEFMVGPGSAEPEGGMDVREGEEESEDEDEEGEEEGEEGEAEEEEEGAGEGEGEGGEGEGEGGEGDGQGDAQEGSEDEGAETDEGSQEGEQGQEGDEGQGGNEEGDRGIDEEGDESASGETTGAGSIGEQGVGAEGTVAGSVDGEDVGTEGQAQEAPAEGAPSGEVSLGGAPVEGGISEQMPIFVPSDELVMPEDPFVTEEFEMHIVPDISDTWEVFGQEEWVMEQEEQIMEQQEQIYQEQQEEVIMEQLLELPPFPGPP